VVFLGRYGGRKQKAVPLLKRASPLRTHCRSALSMMMKFKNAESRTAEGTLYVFDK
jgi:hypothetical protein